MLFIPNSSVVWSLLSKVYIKAQVYTELSSQNISILGTQMAHGLFFKCFNYTPSKLLQ